MTADNQAIPRYADGNAYSLPEEARVRNIDVDQYGILTRENYHNVLVTAFTYSCSGLALAARDNSGVVALAHVYSDADHLAAGDDAVRDHARKVWAELKKALDPKTEFNLVAFGGQKTAQFIQGGKPEQQEIDKFFAMRRENARLQASEEYHRLSWPEMMRAMAEQREYFGSLSTENIHVRLNLYNSGLLNDELFQCAKREDFITRIIDLRYRGVPLDAAVERDTGRIVVSPSQKEPRMFDPDHYPLAGSALPKNMSVIPNPVIPNLK